MSDAPEPPRDPGDRGGDPLEVATGGGERRRALFLLALIATFVCIVWATPLRDQLRISNLDRLRERFQSLGPWAPLGFLAANAIGLMIGAPRVLFALVAGVAFDVWLGCLLAEAGSVIGSAATFAYARALGRPYVAAKLGARFSRLAGMLEALGRHGILSNVVIRSVPIGNSLMLNLLMAVSPVSFSDFVVGTAIGIAPSTVVYVLYGSTAHGELWPKLIGGTLILLAAGALGWFIARRTRIGRELAARSRSSPP